MVLASLKKLSCLQSLHTLKPFVDSRILNWNSIVSAILFVAEFIRVSSLSAIHFSHLVNEKWAQHSADAWFPEVHPDHCRYNEGSGVPNWKSVVVWRRWYHQISSGFLAFLFSQVWAKQAERFHCTVFPRIRNLTASVHFILLVDIVTNKLL